MGFLALGFIFFITIRWPGMILKFFLMLLIFIPIVCIIGQAVGPDTLPN